MYGRSTSCCSSTESALGSACCHSHAAAADSAAGPRGDARDEAPLPPCGGGGS
jgi:hypothetical protein